MTRPRRVMISAGELSGELLALTLVKALKISRPEIQFVGIAGSLLQEEGVTAWIDSKELAVMGFFEVLSLLPKLIQIEEKLFSFIDQDPPDIAILVDYPGFHFRIAPSLKARGIPVVQYVAPKVWAWGENRVFNLRRDFSLVLGVLPFEAEFFKRHQVPYSYVGSPHLDRVDKAVASLNASLAQMTHPLGQKAHEVSEDHSHGQYRSGGVRFSSINPKLTGSELQGLVELRQTHKLITMLPGSRRSEIKMMLKPLLAIGMKLFEKDSSYKFLIPVAAGLDFNWLIKLIADFFQVSAVHCAVYSEVGCFRLYRENSLELMKMSHYSVVTSGTATLECGLIGTPLCVVYRMHKISYFIARYRIKVKWIGLVNLCAGKEIAKEFIQDLNPNIISEHIHGIVADPIRLEAAREELFQMRSRFFGDAELHASARILELMDKS